MKYRVEKPSFIGNRHVSPGEIVELDPKTVHREDTHLMAVAEPISKPAPKPELAPKPTSTSPTSTSVPPKATFAEAPSKPFVPPIDKV